MIGERDRRIYDEAGGADFAYVVELEGDPWQFRVNLFIQMGNPDAFPEKSSGTSPTSTG